jgi:formylglycine-generating enzyme required for sulfatase activity
MLLSWMALWGIEALPETVQADKEITVDLPGGEAMDMVWIEPGKFMMGSPEGQLYAKVDEFPQHQVTISQGFYLGKYEITQAQWEAVMGSQPWVGRSYALAEGRRPAVYITWYDAQDFIARLNQAAGTVVYRLPTEAEWEYACRAGTTTPWYFGDDESELENYAWLRFNTYFSGKAYAQPIGQKGPNAWGLYDMHGNVWEWVEDWFGKYIGEPQVDPTGPATGIYKVVRSGIFMADAAGVRSAFRWAGSPDFPDGGVGARLVRQEPAQSPTAVPQQSWGQIKSHGR